MTTTNEVEMMKAETARAYGTLNVPAAEYQAAEAADRAFERVLVRHFGKGARWRVSPKKYGPETRAAYETKLAADRALHEAFQKGRA